jgi:hypothetical protein
MIRESLVSPLSLGHLFMIKHLTLLVFLMLFSTEANANKYQKNLQVWNDFVSQNKWGNSEDYWLETSTADGWEKIALVMGYWNDWEGCEDIKVFWQTKYPAAKYRCIPANKR